MGRYKVGLDFFSFDTSFDFDLRLIEAEFGMDGLGVVVKLWQRIYGERGYYIEFDDEVALLFADEIKVGANAVSEIVRAAIRRGIFHRDLYDKYKILTSHGIQKRYIEGTSRRVRVEMEERYLLLSSHEIPSNVYINGKNVYINGENVDGNAQSRKEETKEEDNNRGRVRKNPHGRYQNVYLSVDELEDLKKRYPADYQKKIDRLSVGIETKWYQYQNHHATIIQWAEEDEIREREKNKPKASKFNNYEDTNPVDYAAMENLLLDEMVKEDQDGSDD